MFQALFSWLEKNDIEYNVFIFTKELLASLDTILFSIVAYFIAKAILNKVITKIIRKTKTQIDDILLDSNVFAHLPHLAPALILINAIHIIFKDSPTVSELAFRVVYSYIAVLFVLTVNNLLTAIERIYRTLKSNIKLPITAFVQTARIILLLFGILTVVAILMQKSPLVLLSGLGALTAIIMLIFKDSILGFVAGIQLTANKMINFGDWIEMPKYSADGEVIDITLTTVKVQNWDKTISMVPTYALVSESFKNWQGMSESGGRRIKRSLFIDMQSIKYCDEAMIGRLKNIDLIRDYLDSRLQEVKEHNVNRQIRDTSIVNGRQLTNIGTFRTYIEEYLNTNSQINKDMTFIVRQLQPTPQGLPIEIYVFSKEKRWKYYETIQSDIMDHILASVKEFDLKLYQNPSGADIDDLSKILTTKQN